MKMLPSLRRAHSAALFVLLASGVALGRQGEDTPRSARDDYNLGKGHLAIDGYDPVAYFPVGGGRSRKGRKDQVAVHRGIQYRFATAENRAAFLEDPNRYEPAYGGWCAWAMADGKGDKVEVDPESFLVEAGRLYLFYDGFFADTRKQWLKKGGAKLQPNADRNWTRISEEALARRVRLFDLDGGLALGGHDPVAYSAESAAVKGSASISHTHRGVTYRFASRENETAFLGDPARYEPSYGGWDAHAMSRGERVAADPEVFLVREGRLLVFADTRARDSWLAGGGGVAAEAARHWRDLTKG